MDPHTRWFRRLLRLLPSDFQADYARDMERTFHAQQRDARLRGAGGIAALWWETVRDLLRTAPREHLDQLAQDVSYAARNLRSRPAATVAAVATLAIGIGSVTAILSIVNGVDWRPIGYPDPDRLVFVQEEVKGDVSERTGYATFADWRERSRSFSEIAAMSSMSATLTEAGEPEKVAVMRVTPGFFRVIGIEPAIGRGFTDAENQWDNRRFVVLSARVWRRRYGSDPRIAGRAIQLGGRPYVVTGVLPDTAEDLIAQREFDGAELWVPLAYDTSLPFACRTCRHLRVAARLRPGVTPPQAEAEVDAITRQLGRDHPSSYAGAGARVARVSDVLLGPVRPALYLLLAAVGVLLLIAGVNVANLLLVRSVERGPEIATRRALGVATGRLVRQLLTESVVLASIGALCGVLCASLALQGLLALAPDSLPRLDQVTLDGRVLEITVFLAGIVGLLFGLLPAWHLASADLTAFLRGARSVVSGGGRRMGHALVAGNVALAVVLLAVGGLLGRSFAHLVRVDPGFEPAGVTTASVALSGPAYAETAPGLAFYRGVLDRLSDGGGEAAFTSQLPFEQSDSAGLHVEGRIGANPEESPDADRFAVTPGYFATLRIPVLRGRAFTDRDLEISPPVAIINRAAARQVFGDDDPIGRRIMIGGADGPRREIVGIVSDVRHRGLGEPVTLQAYIPLTQFYGGPVWLVVRHGEDAGVAAARIRQAVRDMDRTQAVNDIRTFDAVLAHTLAERRFLLWLIGAFAAAALLLAVIGLYGVVSNVVVQRSRDIGLRMALGAARSDISRLVLRIGMAPVAVGLAAGLLLVTVATRPVEAMLFSVRRFDAATIAGAAAVLFVSALVACYVPARRATRVDPVTALRTD
ncbi:MAG: ABC transporter permease, partial [Vicinamibacterales bacterium]